MAEHVKHFCQELLLPRADANKTGNPVGNAFTPDSMLIPLRASVLSVTCSSSSSFLVICTIPHLSLHYLSPHQLHIPPFLYTIHLSTHQYMYLCIHYLPIYHLSTNPSFTYLSMEIYSPMCLPIHVPPAYSQSPTYPRTEASISIHSYSSIRSSIYISTYPSTVPPIYLTIKHPIYIFTYSSIYPPIGPPIYITYIS